MAKSMVENGFSADKIRVEVMKMLRADKDYQMAVAENTMAYKREVQQIINNTVESAKEAGETLTAEAGDMAWNNDLSMWEQQGEDLTKPNSLSKFVKASSLQTSGALRNLTKTMGFKNTALGTTGVMDMYQREMDLALIKVSTGAFSFDQAVKDCVHRLAQSGLRSIDYESGRSYQLDVAARMAVRTGMSQLSGKITEENLKNSNHDLVITTQHMGSRPDHAVWQNKVFSYSGKSKKYPDFIKETGYGTVTGLKGANCTHDFYPYWEGASIIPEDIKEPDLRTIGGKTYTYYESTQKQRQMERQIRATKREIEATKSIGGDAQDLQNKLRGQMADYKSFSKAAGLKERDNRLRVESGTFILKRKKSKVADHKSADYLMRSHVPGQNVFKERLMTNDVLELMPEKVKKSLQNTIIDIGKDGASQYDYIHDILYVANGAEKSEIIHEIGHVVENKMLDANRVALLRKQMVQDISPNDIIEKIMYDASNNEHKVYIIKSNKFVSEYQGRIYVTDWDEIYDENWNIRDELLWEFISEPFREYIENPNYLKEKYSEFYELIKEIAE